MTPLCACGCGQSVGLAKVTDPRYGLVKGQPTRYLPNHGHAPSRARYVVDEATSCWIWQGKSRSGKYGQYGLARTADGRRVRAHRMVYEERFGPIAKGYELHHGCETPLCVNPEHLEPLTRAEHRQRHG